MSKYSIIFLTFFLVATSLFSAEKFVVVIDPGHGGKDGGAARNSIKEKDINLGVALQLGRLIETNIPDAKVVYTRKTDVFVDLNKRADIANKAKANLFISVHTNSTEAKVTKATGADTYILGLAKSAENLDVAKRENSVILFEDNYNKKYEGFDPNSPESYIIFEFMVNKYMEQSLEFARQVQRDFKSVAKRTDRGVRQAGFLVLKQTSMPSVLIELGFINNPTEAKYLSSDQGQRALASSIFSAFKKYKADFDKKQSSVLGTSKATQPSPVLADTSVEVDQPKGKNKIQTIIKEQNTKGKQQVEKSRAEVSANNGVVVKEAKPVVKESKPAVTKVVETKTVVAPGAVEYRMQFLISQSELPASSPKFKGLSSVTYYKDGSSYKYTYGSVGTMRDAMRLQKEVRQKFPDAFIVKFKNGKRF